jgi:membrane protein DedA with SNARE-associated domain
MNQVRFHVYTFVGSWPWCYALALLGMKLGDKFSTDPRFKAFFDRFHHVVEAAIVLAFVYFLYSHWKNRVRTTAA